MELATIFPSKYIKASDLQGREPTVVIANCEIEKLGDDNKLVLYFQGKEKGLVCNRTNADRIAHLYGSNTDDWIGKEITLYTDMVNFQGKVTEAIRVKASVRRASKPARQLEVQERSTYAVSSMKPAEPPADDADEVIPF